MRRYDNFIGGASMAPANGKTFDRHSPANGTHVATFAAGSAEAAVRAARIESEEVGKPIRYARKDIEGCAKVVHYAAGLAATAKQGCARCGVASPIDLACRAAGFQHPKERTCQSPNSRT